MLSIKALLTLVDHYKYATMFGVLFACGLGLPLPEEVTLIVSGLAVGWEKAHFFWASVACVAGILAGDAFIFAMGRYFGRSFLRLRPMRILLNEKRQLRIERLFARHGSKAVFFARFLAGVRIGVYAYAGQHGMSWLRFLFLDFLGAALSGPTSIAIGAWVGRRIADPDQAAVYARNILHRGTHWIYIILGALVLLALAHWLWMRRGDKRARAAKDMPDPSPQPPPEGSSPRSEEPAVVSSSMEADHRPDREARPGAEPR